MKKRDISKITNYLMDNRKYDSKELGRFIVKDNQDIYNDYYSMWIIKEDERGIFEKTLSIDSFPREFKDEFEGIQISLTYANPSYIFDVLSGDKDINFWQIGNVIRVIKSSIILDDPKGLLAKAKNQAQDITWSPELIRLKRQISLSLLDKALKYFNEDILADAMIWLLKAAEEALCVPLMKRDAYRITTPKFILDILRKTDPFLYQFYSGLLGISEQTIERIQKAYDELEMLAERIFRINKRKDREMWILVSYVSLNTCEMHLRELSNSEKGSDYFQLHFESVIVELWQAYFLISQTPWNRMSPLDQWIVASFWNHFFEWRKNIDFSEKGFKQLISKIESIATL